MKKEKVAGKGEGVEEGGKFWVKKKKVTEKGEGEGGGRRQSLGEEEEGNRKRGRERKEAKFG